MWVLEVRTGSGGQSPGVSSVTKYYLQAREYILGRKDCDILWLNDKTVSRHHAKVRRSSGGDGDDDEMMMMMMMRIVVMMMC